jgi:hypothetical protein
MKIAKLRRKLKDRKWLNRKYLELLDESERLNRFFDFECSSFFKGDKKAEYNRQIYYKKHRQNDRQIEFIESLLTP